MAGRARHRPQAAPSSRSRPSTQSGSSANRRPHCSVYSSPADELARCSRAMTPEMPDGSHCAGSRPSPAVPSSARSRSNCLSSRRWAATFRYRPPGTHSHPCCRPRRPVIGPASWAGQPCRVSRLMRSSIRWVRRASCGCGGRRSAPGASGVTQASRRVVSMERTCRWPPTRIDSAFGPFSEIIRKVGVPD